MGFNNPRARYAAGNLVKHKRFLYLFGGTDGRNHFNNFARFDTEVNDWELDIDPKEYDIEGRRGHITGSTRN